MGHSSTISSNCSCLPANRALVASSKPGLSPAMADRNRYADSCARRWRSLPWFARLACSTSLRNATEAPPGWLASHSQCRGISVTSRATTPNLGRPGRRVSPSGWGGALLCMGPAPWSLIRRKTSSGLPRKSTSTKLLVTSSKIRICAHLSRFITAFAFSATRSRSPEAIRLVPTNAVQHVVGDSVTKRLIVPGCNCIIRVQLGFVKTVPPLGALLRPGLHDYPPTHTGQRRQPTPGSPPGPNPHMSGKSPSRRSPDSSRDVATPSASDSTLEFEAWCGRRDLNPHGPCGPTDFHTRLRLSPPCCPAARFGVWTIPSPCPDLAPGVRCCPSSLYTFPAVSGWAWLGIAISQGSPTLSSPASPRYARPWGLLWCPGWGSNPHDA
jgi:hypothetical protein